MNNQKDTQKTDINSYGQSNVLDVKTLNGKHIYDFANKKTEKLVTALYMVTDCMDTDDALKSKLRQLGVELLSDMYKLSGLSPMDKHVHISASLSRVHEIISFVEIANTIGFISDMNTSILKKEFIILVGELDSHQIKDKHFTFTLDEQMFSLPTLSESNPESDNKIMNKSSIKDISNYSDKRTNFNVMPFTNNKTNLSINRIPKVIHHVSSVTGKEERTSKILGLIKDMSLQTGKEVSIKDISNSFKDCSEKTIQRELNSLVSKGQIKKIGSKRWSRYMIITKD
jgi:hypothetical protein